MAPVEAGPGLRWTMKGRSLDLRSKGWGRRTTDSGRKSDAPQAMAALRVAPRRTMPCHAVPCPQRLASERAREPTVAATAAAVPARG